MQPSFFSFNRVLVMDSLYFSAVGLCALVDNHAGQPVSYRVSTFSALKTQLQISIAAKERVLVITELVSGSEPLCEGLQFLDNVKAGLEAGHFKVVVCTALSDPFLLSAVIDRGPNVIVHRDEPLDVLIRLIYFTKNKQSITSLSPLILNKVERVRGIRITQRELEWLVIQTEKMGLTETARRMGIHYKTAATYRRKISKHLNIHIREMDSLLAKL
ncbi:hypothetical protein NNO04_20475 [Citrobacter sp. Awk 4]|uniref:hypothetical protein n=1 Tax=Citrobacter sp. Awk 4 TaxID=2963955 RepID=UPI0023039876|nr:hypothetical protein [Citrobacter sp. Awk 4]MDA8481056.1 hypothetical protein [Citrobacter sp. Awk 4]